MFVWRKGQRRSPPPLSVTARRRDRTWGWNPNPVSSPASRCPWTVLHARRGPGAPRPAPLVSLAPAGTRPAGRCAARRRAQSPAAPAVGVLSSPQPERMAFVQLGEPLAHSPVAFVSTHLPPLRSACSPGRGRREGPRHTWALLGVCAATFGRVHVSGPHAAWLGWSEHLVGLLGLMHTFHRQTGVLQGRLVPGCPQMPGE